MSTPGHPGPANDRRGGPPTGVVVPRARLWGETAALPVEQQISRWLEHHSRGLINVAGAPGSGKTTAVGRIERAFAGKTHIVLVDDPADPNLKRLSDAWPTVVTSCRPIEPNRFTTLELVPWDKEEVIEYLLATHSQRCKSVMNRLNGSSAWDDLQGIAELWRIVLDELAADDSLAGADEALIRFLEGELTDPAEHDAVAQRCLVPRSAVPDVAEPKPSPLREPIARLVRHDWVRELIAGQWLAGNLDNPHSHHHLATRLPSGVIRRAATLAQRSPPSAKLLEELVCGEDRRLHPMAISLLHAMKTGWRPPRGLVPNLSGAWLAGVEWYSIGLARVRMKQAYLPRADLSGGDLTAALMNESHMPGIQLRNALLEGASLTDADLTGANLAGSTANRADFARAKLLRANFCGASLRKASFREADLTGATFCRADLTGAELLDAQIEGANFCGADMTEVALPGRPLTTAAFANTRLCAANLTGCDLEGLDARDMDFSRAILTQSLLTGSTLPSANFAGAHLMLCGLAEIDWEEADLRDANLARSTFHIGSTRSGLVGSAIPCEGSRTGFYTDDFDDREFKNPQEIRKANLCGADLLGANIQGVDFYLVDLRQARYSTDQAEWFRKCGAIL